jgi:hypothetical protein
MLPFVSKRAVPRRKVEMAKSMGGDLVLRLLQEFREHQQDYKGFKQEMLDFKRDMLEFKQDYLGFKRDMLEFREIVEVRLDLQQQAHAQTHGYLKIIVNMLKSMKEELGGVQQRVGGHDERLDDHEQRLMKLEK